MLATDDVNVCTVEDPIEMVEPSFNQSQVQPGIEFGFSDSLRALMRQDPDIIMVGEIRDRDTADMAIQSALTGHLVFSTLHTNDAPSAITRLRDLGIPNYLIQASLSGVMAQRLVRTLCTHCKQPMPEEDRHTLHTLLQQYVQTLGDKDPIKQKLLDLTQRATLYHPQGCSHCRQTGYHGRTGVYELLTVTTTFRKAIAQQAGLEELSQLALHEGMTPLRLAALAEVLQGNTSLSEALDCTSDWQ